MKTYYWAAASPVWVSAVPSAGVASDCSSCGWLASVDSEAGFSSDVFGVAELELVAFDFYQG